MRIACLQFAPQVGDVDNNLNRADAVLSRANPKDLDLLVLPELAFSGYNFRSLQHISPFLEPTTSGITSLWARTTALKYNCAVTVGYPEKVDVAPKWPASPEYYNSAITVNADGETIANYRKSFLYYTDETWALEGPDGFFDGEVEGLGNVAMGICMDLNPYKFEAPWNAWEFAFHILHKEANLVIISMAWLTREDARSYSRSPKDPDMDTLSYWLARLEPLIRAETEEEIVVIFANRCGTEDEAVYAGTSAVLGIHAGEVKVYGILGRGEKELLVVDTQDKPKAKLIAEPGAGARQPPVSRNTESTASDRSLMSADTNSSTSTNLTIPDDGEHLNIDDLVTPLTPTDPISPNAFFQIMDHKPQKGKAEAIREALKSSAGQQNIPAPQPTSPTFNRPTSPKSRNASRTRNADVSQPALIAHDLAQEPQTSQRSIGVKSPALGSAPLAKPSDSGGLRPRSPSTSPRPKSCVW
ncbi:hypothetical protein BP5796_08494 [Coleophoma crateriformis]|uniref:CN hydrolase domain-containing protein n=1 Tax=Coleophoma crateriformis TaxID=565419 RepID=A0A3D8R7T2_9HELO|nr:hypothetical protein BP5796_08494 [Coleophoma crateriformis]